MRLIWRQRLGRPECPYMTRWVLDLGWFAIRLHHWVASDDQRNPHDHPFWYITFILWGGYQDKSPSGDTRMHVGKVACRRASHQHTVLVDRGGCWSLLLTGPETREWGFWVGGKFRRRNKYFFEHGHHPCEASPRA